MMTRILDWAANWRLRLGLGALAVAAFPAVTLVAALSIIGLPIAIFLALLPGAAFLLLPAAFLKDRLERASNWATAWVVALGSVCLAAAGAADAINAGLDRKASMLRAGDIDEIRDAPIRSIALVTDRTFRERGAYACQGACLRLLLTGAVDKVLIANAADPFAIDDATPAIAARFEKRSTCEELRIADADLFIKGEANRAGEFARRRIAAGECLVERRTQLGEADAVIIYGAIEKGKNAYTAGLDPVADTVSAKRLSYRRRAAGEIQEEFRWTGVIVRKHPPIVFPTIVTGYGFEAKVGFARFDQRFGFKSRFDNEPDLADFLENKLGLSIRLGEESAPDQRGLIDTIIARQIGRATAADLAVFDDFLQSLSTGRQRATARADAERAARILQSLEIELTRAGPGAVRAIGAAHPDLVHEIVGAQFQRLFATDPEARESRYRDPYIPRIAQAIAAAPDDALRMRRSEFSRLARDRDRRAQSASALARLSVFGADAEDEALGVVAAALDEERIEAPDNDSWRDLYRAGLISLCRLESKKGAAELEAKTTADPSLRRWPHRDLLIRTLIAGGRTDPEVMTALSVPGMDEDARDDLARDVSQARRRPDCS